MKKLTKEEKELNRRDRESMKLGQELDHLRAKIKTFDNKYKISQFEGEEDKGWTINDLIMLMSHHAESLFIGGSEALSERGVKLPLGKALYYEEKPY